MPSKLQTGDSPLGADSITGANLSPASGFVRIEQEIKKRTPQTGTNVGRWNLPNGISILPKRARAASGTSNPWRVSLTKSEGVYTARISEGRIYNGLLSVTEMAFDTEVVDGNTQSVGQGSTVVANDVVCIKYTYPSGPTPAKIEFAKLNAGAGFANWEAIEETGNPAVITATRYPLAKIIDAGNSTLKVEQIATANLALVSMCYDSKSVTSFTPY